MSILDGCTKEVIEQFGGAFPLIDPVDLGPNQAALAYNCEFNPSKVQPRKGFATAWSPNRLVQSMKYWAQGLSGSQTQYLAYLHDNTTLTVRNLSTGVDVDILTGLTDNSIAVMAPSGQRLYAAILSAAGYESHPGYVWDGNVAHAMDQAFQRPLLTTELTLSATQPGVGVCTQGTHYLGVLLETRSGYWGRPSPATNTAALTLSPLSLTAADSAHNIQLTLTPTGNWGAQWKNAQVIYTTSANSFEYYLVPGTITSIPVGTSTAVTITFSISDQQLRSIGAQGAGSLATDYFDLLSQDNTGAAPFNVKFVIPWGNRIVWFGNYGGIDSFFPSDPGNPEWISADQHIQNLPGGLPISSAFVLRNFLYVLSPIGGLYAFRDNGGRPVTFQPPQEIDSSIGTPAPMGVTVDSSGNGYALIATPQGLYPFEGVNFPNIPASYFAQPDWDNIDWSKFTDIVVKDHQQDRNFFVRATMLDGTKRIFHFNYLNGRTAPKLNYSVWTVGASYPLGPIEIVRNVTKNVWELWIGPSTAGAGNPVLRQKSAKAGDLNIYHDLTSTGIDWRHLGPPVPSNDKGEMRNHIAGRVRAVSLSGTSSLYVTVQSLDGSRTVTPNGSPFSLSTTPDQPLLIPYDFTNENAQYLFSNNSVADNAPMIAYLEHFSNVMAVSR